MRGEARADVAHELQARGGVRVRGPVDAILEDQVLLGERLPARHDFRLRFEDEGSLEDEEAMEW